VTQVLELELVVLVVRNATLVVALFLMRRPIEATSST
jgi:hypothetical protein